MSTRTQLARILAAGALCATSALCAAQTPTASEAFDVQSMKMPYQKDFWGYAGIGIGQSNFHMTCGPTVQPCEDKSWAARVWTGGRFNRFFGMDVGYTHLGEADIGPGSYRAQGLFLHLLGGIPFGDGTSSINGKVGTIYSRATQPLFSESEKDFGWSYGAAAIIALNKAMDLRFDWDRHNVQFITGAKNVDMYSVGVQWKFR